MLSRPNLHAKCSSVDPSSSAAWECGFQGKIFKNFQKFPPLFFFWLTVLDVDGVAGHLDELADAHVVVVDCAEERTLVDHQRHFFFVFLRARVSFRFFSSSSLSHRRAKHAPG
jgi:hypothetical protein